MAKRRMFSLDVVDTDSFLDLPASSQSLYFHLGMRADDDGFVSSPKRITAMVGAAGDDLKLLIAKGFVIPFESGVCVIRDWRVNNYIQRDRYTPSIYTEEKQRLSIAENGRYSHVDTQCIQDVSKSDTQVRIDIELPDGPLTNEGEPCVITTCTLTVEELGLKNHAKRGKVCSE